MSYLHHPLAISRKALPVNCATPHRSRGIMHWFTNYFAITNKITMLKIPPPIITLLVFTGMYVLSRFVPLGRIDLPALTYVGFLLMAAGIAIDLIGAIQFRRARTTINPLKPQNSTAIVKTGLYRISRNPMYLGMLIVLTGVAFILKTVVAFLLLPLFVLQINRLQIIPEETILAKKFPVEYPDYKKSVRRWL